MYGRRNWTTPTLRRLTIAGRFRWCLSSSRFDRTPATLLWAFALYVTGRHVVVFTEVANDKRAAMLRRIPGWEVWQGPSRGGRDECAVAYRRRYFREVWGHTRALTKTAPSSGFRTVWAPFVLLEHWRTGQTVLVSVAHSPAHVEYGAKWRTRNGRATADVLAYREFLEAWPDLLREYAARDDVDHVLALADLNVNQRLEAWRDRLHKAFRPFVSVWAGNLPRTGSHKTTGRLIDGGYTDLETDRQGVGRLNRSSDHRPIYGRSTLRRIRKPAAWRRIVAARHARWAK